MNKLNVMIDYYRKENQMTLDQLGVAIGKSKSAISRWIKGDRSPMVEDVERLATLFQTDVHTLLYGFESKPNKLSKPTTVSVSKTTASIIKLLKNMSENDQKELLRFAEKIGQNHTQSILRFPIQVTESLAAGIGFSYDAQNEKTIRYTNRDNLKRYDIASLVSGDSMEPMVSNGDVVLIKKNMDWISGSVYAIDYNEKSYIKKVYFEKDNLRLVSLNDKYDDILIPRNTEHYLNIVGLVVDWFTPIA